MFAKIVVIAILFGIISSLGMGLFYLVKDRGGGSKRMARALTVRIGVSIGLFVLLLILGAMGFIAPHGVMP
jgi:hypothetical protein